MLSVLIQRAKEKGRIQGAVPYLVENGYANNTILFIKHDLQHARNLKVLLCAFELLSGLKINFHKSELFLFGKAIEYKNQYKDHFAVRWVLCPSNT